MKYVLLIVLVISYSTSFAQNAFQYQNTYTGYAVNGNDIVLPITRGGSDYGGKPYFSKDWVSGSVTTTDKNTFSDKLVFLYDKVNSTLYFKSKDSNTLMKADMSKISSFILSTDKPHTFINGNLIGNAYNGKFFEVLLLDENKYSLFKLTDTHFEHTQTSKASQALTESLSTGNYIDHVTYYIFYKNILQPVELKKKLFPKFMNADADKAEAYMKTNNSNFNESYVINMLDTINEQIQ